MAMKQAIAVVVVVLVTAAYVAGYWPEHERRAYAEARGRELQARLDSAEARVRLGEVLGQSLRVSDAVDARNFGDAAALSSAYFDRVRQEAITQPPDVQQALDRILQNRDRVTAALARSDPAVAIELRTEQLEVRRALGYPVEEGSPIESSTK